MKLVYKSMEIPIQFKENVINVLVLENQRFYRTFLQELLKNLAMDNGMFVLSRDNRECVLGKEMEVLIDPFHLEINTHRVLTELYKKLGVTAEGYELFEETSRIKAMLGAYLVQLTQVADLPLVFDEEISLASLWKTTNIKFEDEYSSLLEKLVAYMELLKAFCKTEILCLVNIKTLFTLEELRELYKAANYNKIHLLLLESNTANEIMENESTVIVDNDLCEIIK